MENTPKGIRKTHNSLCSDSMRFPHNGLFSMYEDVRRLLQMPAMLRPGFLQLYVENPSENTVTSVQALRSRISYGFIHEK